MKKKKEDMTFKEFWEECKKTGALEVIEDPNFGMLMVLHKEGFSDEEINRMKMEKVLKLYNNSVFAVLDKYFAAIASAYKNMPGAASILDPFLKKINELLENEKKE